MQVAMASTALIFGNLQQSSVFFMLVVTIRTLAYFTRNLARLMRCDRSGKHNGPGSKIKAGATLRTVLQQTVVTLSAGPIHRGFCLLVGVPEPVPTSPRLDMATLAVKGGVG
jgi:hypothetical protein